MSDEAEEVVPDQPLDPLVDEVDNEVREETRETSRENLSVYLDGDRRGSRCSPARTRWRWRSACARVTPPPRPD